MYSWIGFLTDVAWLGPFAAVAIMKLVEILFARPVASTTARPPNITFGVIAFVLSLGSSYLLAEPVIRLAYRANLGSFADFPVSPVLQVVLALLLLDLLMYANHVAMHRFDLLWRAHRVHHADTFLTASSGLLHHPFEIVWTFLVTLVFSVVFGIPSGAVLIYSAIGAIHTAFSHASFRYPRVLDKIIGSVLVMPDIHRIHHSVNPVEWNANYGQILIVWDRLFRTYIETPAGGDALLKTGTEGIDPNELGLIPLLKSPLQ
jgi:sterol desaturase/sphingolipid hydroxylase (fatty acid hydroxylase superfamily)